MAPKIGPSPNLPRTDPYWQEQRSIDGRGKDLTPEEAKISKEQTDEVNKLDVTLRQPFKKEIEKRHELELIRCKNNVKASLLKIKSTCITCCKPTTEQQKRFIIAYPQQAEISVENA